MEEYILPQKLSEKFKLRFLKPTTRVGEWLIFQGFTVKLPNSAELRERSWSSLSTLVGDFEVVGITPFPEDGFPVLPAVISRRLGKLPRVAEIEGRILDFSQFSHLSGRFILVEKLKPISLEKYLSLEKSGLDGRKIYNILDLSFPERLRDAMVPYFLSSSGYLFRIGGCTLSFLDTLSKYYASDFSAVRELLLSLHPLLRKNTVKVRLHYLDDFEIQVRGDLKIKYQSLASRSALKFYSKRKGREWEKSAFTQSDIRMEEIIGVSDIPFIPTREEIQVYGDEIREYGLDIARYVLEKHLERPLMTDESVDIFKERLIGKLEKELPLLSEAMKMGIVMDMANVNGFGEHLARLLNSWERLNMGNPGDKVQLFYIHVLERLEDVLQDRLRRELAALSEKKRVERIINRVLWELNTLRPEGWSYEYFEKKIEERGLEDRTSKIFEALLRENIIIRKNGGYVAISSL